VTTLAIDGALGGFSAALDDGTRIVGAGSQIADALEAGLDRIAEVVARAGVELRAIERVAVGTGPGSFTGLRIAVAYAKSFAYGSGASLVGVSSYDALEPDAAPLPRITIVHGRRGVICARWCDEHGSAIACGTIADVLDRLLPAQPAASAELAAAGNTEDVIAQIAERGWNVRALSLRAELPAIAIAQIARGRTPLASLHVLAPDYGEAPAVTPARTR
jgi:tRNA threonylcarbamoyladenosine biosynthesis protein TsaB